MAYQKKYYLTYKTLKNDGVSNTIEFWQNTTDVLVAEEIKGGPSPFIIEMPDLSHKFQVVRGTGGMIELFSDTDMKFFAGLEHIDFTEFMVLHYVGGVLNWCGYLNADMQSEPYDIDFNYLISTSANDGFALLERYRFLQSDETKYVGLKSKWELLQICLNKLALPYTDIGVKLATTFTGFSGDAANTILHESFINCANFYDEDGEAMTMREVIESILAPYGAFICQSNGSIYITDIHTLAGGGTISFQKYNASTYAYISNVNFVAEKDVSDIGYHGTGHSIERSGGTNQQRVVYSSYPQKILTEETIVRPTEFSVVPETFSDKDGYKYRTLDVNNFWHNLIATADFEESYITGSDEHFVYYRLPRLINGISALEFLNPESYFLTISPTELGDVVSISGRRKRYLDGVAFLITGEILVKTKPNPYTRTYTNDEINAGADKVTRFGLNFDMSIGDYFYDPATGSFELSYNHDAYIYTTNNAEYISNKWVSLGLNGDGMLVPLSNFNGDVLAGFFGFKIYTDTILAINGGEDVLNSMILDEVWIRNLQIKLVNKDGSEIDDADFEYIGKLNKLFAQEGDEIVLNTGSRIGFVDLGKIIIPDGDYYKYAEEWTRAGETYRIEELLLNSLCSNYRMNYLTLLGMNLKNEFGIMNVLTDSAYISGKKFMVKSATIDFAEYRNTVNLVEISQDVLDIVKES